MSSSITTSSGRARHNSMHEFIKAVQDYCTNRTDESSTIINRHLQLYSVCIDTSVFDPNTSVVCEFFVSMYELLKHVEPRSSLSWGCINVLSAACRNPAARHSLIHTYQFIPLIARILGGHLSSEKKIRLLNLMQELSCGVKISWIIPNLEHLMTTLTQWVMHERDEEIILLSLGVIVNLCYKNLPAIYMLSKCVDIKNFLKVCACLKGVKLEACSCKLFIILEKLQGLSDSMFLKLLDLTFLSIQESFLARDPVVLRQNVEFYLDVSVENENNLKLVTSSANNYEEKVQNLLLVIKNNVNASGDSAPHDPECMSLVFKFLKSIIDLRMPCLEHFYETVTQIALNWIETELVCTDALYVLRSITSCSKNVHLLEVLLVAIPILTVGLQNIDSDTIMNIEQCKRLIAVMDLLKTLVVSAETRERVMEFLAKDTLCKVFSLLFGEDCSSPRERANDASNSTPEAFALYVNTLSLMSTVAKYNADWTQTVLGLLEKKQIHAVLAEGMHTGGKEMRASILKMISDVPNFPCEIIALAMSELQPIRPVVSSQSNQDHGMCYPLLTSHSSAPDEAIRLLNEARASQRINISTCDVMELYEYKIATMGHAERAAMASMEAASQRCTHLQHQTAQLTAELSRIRQLFLHTQQVQKESEKVIQNLKGECALRKSLQQKLEVCTGELEELKKAYKVLEVEKNKALEAIPPLQQLLKKFEKNCEYKDQMISTLKGEADNLKTMLNTTEKDLAKSERELEKKNKELVGAFQQIEQTQKLLETISKLSNAHAK